MGKRLDAVHSHFTTAEEPAAGLQGIRVTKTCSFCSKKMVYRNVHQLIMHLACPTDGIGKGSACKGIGSTEGGIAVRGRYRERVAARAKPAHEKSVKEMRLAQARAAQHDEKRRKVGGQRTIQAAFSSQAVLATGVESSIGRWQVAAGIPPNAFSHPLWLEAFAAIRNAPATMRPPRGQKFAAGLRPFLRDPRDRGRGPQSRFRFSISIFSPYG